jgi:hypothetical protein
VLRRSVESATQIGHLALHSITLSAMSSSSDCTSMPSTRAVLALENAAGTRKLIGLVLGRAGQRTHDKLFA